MGIGCEFNRRYMLEHNRVAEKKNRSIMEVARAMLEEKSLPKFYWVEAIWTAVYIQNQIKENVSTHELYSGESRT